MRRMDEWMDGRTDGRTDVRTDGRMHAWMGGWMDGCMHGWVDGWMDGCMHGWVDGWTDACMDGWMEIITVIETLLLGNQSSHFYFINVDNYLLVHTSLCKSNFAPLSWRILRISSFSTTFGFPGGIFFINQCNGVSLPR